jgi:hypothetical protein
MRKEDLEKLPADVKKEFMKYAIKLAEKKKQSAAHDDFLTFTKHVWPEFIEGDHHKKIAEKFNRLAKGECKRIIINMPPRHTKSEFASNLLPAWMVGRKPDLKIIQTTHTTELAIRFGRKAKNLIDSPEYQEIFKTRLKKIHKPRVNGKPNKAVNTTQPVLVQPSRVVERIYLLLMTHTQSKTHLI